jgi:D-glycero-alpha-D-manno-heptose-7-phosphate kinase
LIISRTPLRVSFSGGGSDLPEYYNEEPGAVLSTTIDKYVYVGINQRFDNNIKLKYSQIETCSDSSEIKHPIFNNIIRKYVPNDKLEFTSMADIPAGTGLGSSSSFTVGLINAVGTLKGYSKSPEELADEACDTEINDLREPIGKQDQYAAAFGGLNFIKFIPGSVIVERLRLTSSTINSLESQCLLAFTGQTRAAKSVLQEQRSGIEQSRSAIRDMVKISEKMRDVLESGEISWFGDLLHESWLLKRSISSNVSNSNIDEWYTRARSAGVTGGKILGAGNGGFMLLFCPVSKQDKVKQELNNLRFINIKFESKGSKIVE